MIDTPPDPRWRKFFLILNPRTFLSHSHAPLQATSDATWNRLWSCNMNKNMKIMEIALENVEHEIQQTHPANIFSVVRIKDTMRTT